MKIGHIESSERDYCAKCGKITRDYVLHKIDGVKIQIALCGKCGYKGVESWMNKMKPILTLIKQIVRS